jgi:small subunit ribosomal protein S5
MAKNPRRNQKPFKKEPKEFEEVVLQIARVTRVVKGGRRLRFRATVAIGNRKGKVGLGIGKSAEVSTAIQKAVHMAKKCLVTPPIVNETIPHDVKIKYKSAEILMMPAQLGKGIIAGGATRTIMELAGYKNVLGKRFGASNMLANAQATMKALELLELAPGQKRDELKTEEKRERKSVKTIRPAHTLGRKKEGAAAPKSAVEVAAAAVEATAEAPAAEENKAE